MCDQSSTGNNLWSDSFPKFLIVDMVSETDSSFGLVLPARRSSRTHIACSRSSHISRFSRLVSILESLKEASRKIQEMVEGANPQSSSISSMSLFLFSLLLCSFASHCGWKVAGPNHPQNPADPYLVF
jgi:hypothetical protein